MHKHPITYTNFNGEQRSKELYFNLTEAELTKLQKEYLDQGGIQAVMNAAIASGNTRTLLDFFEIMVRRSYGIKSPDGEIFDKSEKIWNDFENSAYYSDLYMSFFQDEGRVGQAFLRAVMPVELINKAEANVRGEGDLTQAAQQFKPDARTVFEQSRDNLKDHIQKVENTQNIFTQPTHQVPPTQPEQTIGQEAGWDAPQQNSERYVPQNQPQAPTFGGTPMVQPTTEGNVQTTEFRVPAEAQHNESPQTRQQLAAERAADQQHIARPPHESGEGYQL